MLDLYNLERTESYEYGQHMDVNVEGGDFVVPLPVLQDLTPLRADYRYHGAS